MKLYATDYDGTLNCRGITSELTDAICRWRTAGNLFGVVSGRPYVSLRDRLAEDGIPYDFVVSNNGAIITYKGTHISETVIPQSDAIALADFLRGFEYKPFRVDCPDFYFGYDYIPELIPVPGGTKIEDTVFPEITEITALYPDYETTLMICRAVNEKMGDRINPLIPSDTSIDFVSAKTDKAIGVNTAIDLLGIKPEIILTTGDSPNDLAMLTAPGFTGYAVESALPPVLSIVKNTVASPVELINMYL